METSYLLNKYCNAQVCVQTQLHSLLLHFHNQMGSLSNMTGESLAYLYNVNSIFHENTYKQHGYQSTDCLV